MRLARKVISICLVLVAALMLAVTLTVPAIAATAPAILTIALAVFAFLMWPRRRREVIVYRETPTH